MTQFLFQILGDTNLFSPSPPPSQQLNSPTSGSPYTSPYSTLKPGQLPNVVSSLSTPYPIGPSLVGASNTLPGNQPATNFINPSHLNKDILKLLGSTTDNLAATRAGAQTGNKYGIQPSLDNRTLGSNFGNMDTSVNGTATASHDCSKHK